MTRKEVKEMLPVFQAYAEGKEIESLVNGKYYRVLEICNGMNPKDYRIKPEPKYRPFANAEECWQEMQKSIFKIQTAVETLTRQKVIDKNVYDFVHREIKSLSESVENIVEVNNPDETLLTFTDKEKYINQHINLADTSVLCKELNRRKEIGNDFLVISTEGKIG